MVKLTLDGGSESVTAVFGKRPNGFDIITPGLGLMVCIHEPLKRRALELILIIKLAGITVTSILNSHISN